MLKRFFSNVNEILQTHIYTKVSALILTVIITFIGAGWMGAITAGTTFAQSTAIKLVKPVTDSIRERQDSADARVRSILDSIAQITATQEEAKDLNETIIAAQRQADPRFDQALQDMARAGEMARQKKKENRELMKRLANKSKTQ